MAWDVAFPRFSTLIVPRRYETGCSCDSCLRLGGANKFLGKGKSDDDVDFVCGCRSVLLIDVGNYRSR